MRALRFAVMWSVLSALACSGSSPTTDGGTGGGSAGGVAGGSGGSGGGGTAGGATGGGAAGGDDAGAFDAGDFSCAGQPLPTSASSVVTLTGVVKTLNGFSLEPLAGVTVSAWAESGSAALATSVTADGGAFTLSVSTSGLPIAGYLKAQAAGKVDTYYYPPLPFAVDAPVGTVTVFTGDTLSLLAQVANVTQQPGKARAVVALVDCGGTGVPEAKLSLTPAGNATITYFANGVPSTTATTTDADGIAGVFNLATGAVTVAASVHGRPLRAHPVTARPDAVTQTALRP